MMKEFNYEEFEGIMGDSTSNKYKGSQMEVIPLSRWFSTPSLYKTSYTWSYPSPRPRGSISSCLPVFGVRRASISCVASYTPLPQKEALSPIASCSSSFSSIRLSVTSLSGWSNTAGSTTALCRSCHELMRINHVLWYAWFIRGISLAGSSEDADGGGSSSSSSKGEACTRCGLGFSFLFNRRATCTNCQHHVCRKSCATWDHQAKNYLCNTCTKPPKDHPPPPPAAEVEAGVRGHIESLVEGRLGGPIDQVNITPNTEHPNWAQVFSTHHASLSQAVANLSYSLQMSILNREVPPSSSPSVRHTQLSEALGRVLQESSMILPCSGGQRGGGYSPVGSPEMPVEDYNSQTYEDILATAILNKVLEKCESNHKSAGAGEVTIELTQDSASTDTDSGCSGGHTESRRRRALEERNSISEGSEDSSIASPLNTAQSEEGYDAVSSSILSRAGAASPDQGVASDDAWQDKAPLTFKIEEHVEEITTEHLTGEEDSEYETPEYREGTSDSEGSFRGSRTSLDSRNGRNRHSRGHHSRSTRSHTRYHQEETDNHRSLLPALNFTLPDNINEAIRRVSFPELGADIVGESCLNDSEEEVCPGDLVVNGDASWEENWLFQKNRLVGNRDTQQDPVTMLIPNPNDTVVATVGNSIQVM